MMNDIKHYLVLTPLFLSLACSADNDRVSLGENDKASTTQGLAAYEGEWDGYVEAHQFSSGSDRVRLTLDEEGNGTIQFGDAPAIAAFSDPSVGYPTSWSFEDPSYRLNAHSLLTEGFDYPVESAAVTSGRLRFAFWATDLAKAWCEAQTPVADGSTPPQYGCSPIGFEHGLGADCTPEGSGYDCGQVLTCNFACTCDQTSCTSVRYPQGGKLELDGALTDGGDTLVGTLFVTRDDDASISGPPSVERVTVRLNR